MANYNISSGEVINGGILANSSMTVLNGGVVNSITINSRGWLAVSSGGLANNTILNRSASLRVFSGGLTNSTTVNFSGSLRVTSGGTANGTILTSGGSIFVSSGGTANDTALSGGCLEVFSGGIANNTVLSRGWLEVFSGGIVNNTVLSGGLLDVFSGGTANSMIVSSGGKLYVSTGGTATVVVENGGIVFIEAGGIVSFASNTFSGLEIATPATVHSGTTANRITIKNRGKLSVFSGGITNDTTVISSGSLNIESGGTANRTMVSIGGSLNVSSGGIADSTVMSAGSLTISSGGTANGTILNSGGSIFVSSGGTANGTVLSGGCLEVFSGGIANGTIINSGGRFDISAGASVNSTILYFDCSIFVSLGGTANNTILNSGGSLHILSGGIANGTILNSGGRFDISAGASVNETEIESGGRMFIASNGMAIGTVVSSGGRMHVFSGGDIAFTTVLSGGKLGGGFKYKDVTFDSDSVLYFDISGAISDDPNVFVDLDGYSESQDAPSFTILIADSQKTGTYKLAGNAWGFDQTISIINDVAELTTISIGNTVEINGNDYTLALNDGDLVLSVRNLDPQYVYLDFDGETEATFSNSALDLSFSLSVPNPGFSEMQKQTILSGLSEKYGNSVIFTLERPEDAKYSTLYFGKSDVFNDYGDFFGIAEAYDESNQCRDDDAFVLLDQSYSDEQRLSVACNMLDRIMGYSCLKYDDTDIRKYAQSKYLLSTEWHQGYPYNKYCPIDPVAEARCLVGCTNTAAAQIINYWLENGMLDFTLSLEDSDTYKSNRSNLVLITIDSSDSPAAGYLSFAETNRLLSNYESGNEDSIAALCFAAGVVQQANYSAEATGTTWSWIDDLFYRSGFDKTLVGYGRSYGLSYEAIIKDLLHGHPVAVSASYNHTLIIDGYDSSSDMFHLNYGWGGGSDGWYTREKLDFVSSVITGIAPIVFPDLEVGDLSANANYVYLNDDITLHFTVSNEGSKCNTASFAYVYNGDELLGWTGFSHISPGESRNVACTVSASALPVGENTLTVKVYTQKEEDSVSSASLTIRHSGEERPDVPIPKNLVGMAEQVSWDMTGAEQYIVEYSTDNFEHVVSVVTAGDAIDIFDLPEETYQWRVKAADIDEWAVGNEIVAEKKGDAPQLVKSDADGNADVFFANAAGTWESAYLAQHVGSIGDWNGTNEYAALYGKNKLADIIEGSTDANILLMTDDENGDTLFVDDIYTASHGDLAEKQSRIAQINEIRAGAGDDIVDMTSQRFEYVGDGLTIHGGAGNDVIWANKGDNFLFGDAGNDRIVGASGNDVIVGGIGNDRLHGGGGDDVFTFCDNWGTDNVEQLAGGSVTLWFASEQKGVWDDSTLTYTDGANSVTIKGVAAEQITLKFGDDGSGQFAALSGMGAFFDATTERIFEETGKGLLAKL